MPFQNLPLFERWTAHLTVVALTILGLLAVRAQPATTSSTLAAGPDVAQEDYQLDLTVGAGTGWLIPSLVPLTFNAQQEHRQDIVKYTVQQNDNISSIARRFGIRPETLVWANPDLEADPDFVSIGQQLDVLPVDGVYHTVSTGDTIESIARKYQAEASAIINLAWNDLKDDPSLKAGDKIIVPGGQKPLSSRPTARVNPPPTGGAGPLNLGAARRTASFRWPVSGVVTQGYFAWHHAIDIGAPLGTPVYASDAGTVTWAGWSAQGWGNMILIDHGNGFVTLYGHLSSFAVTTGQSVAKGQVIGRVGSTGRSTGPHLDFRIILNGSYQNPYSYLR